MAGGQLQLDLTAHVDPATCKHREDVPCIGRVLCHKDGKEIYTNCTEGLCGEPPRCAWEEPDNSPEAVARRLKWIKEHKEELKDEHDADDHR